MSTKNEKEPLVVRERTFDKIKVEDLSNDVLDLIEKKKTITINVDLDKTKKVSMASGSESDMPIMFKSIDDLANGNNVFFVGAAGTGKTTLAENIAWLLAGVDFNKSEEKTKHASQNGYPFVTINCNQWTSPTDLKGGQTIEGYKEGGMIEAWRDGKMLILDEMPKLDPNTAGILNDALAKSGNEGAVIYNGLNNPIVKHKNFCCVATGNTTGKNTSENYVGNNKQDSSLLDRFSSSIYTVGFNISLEQRLIFPTVWDICNKIRNALNISGQDTEDIMTLRTMLNIQKSYIVEMLREIGELPANQYGKTLKDAIDNYLENIDNNRIDEVKNAIDYNSFINSYKDVKAFSTSYKSRKQ